MRSLPRIVRICSEVGRTADWLEASVRLLRGELPACGPGSEAVVTRVTDVLIAQAFRAALVSQHDGGMPVAALGDPQIGAAVRYVHEDPTHRWTVTELAARVALSRSAFSERFRTLTGESPMRYVARYRLARAAELLRDSDAQLAAIAQSSGYGSEASLCRAFKRWFGMPPGTYRRRARAER